MFVVTGGGSGIGRALAQALASREQSVLIVGRHENTLRETAESYKTIHFCAADVSTPQGREVIISYLNSVKKIQGLVHNAGIIDPITSLETISYDEWRQVMATNLDAPLFLTQALQKKLAGGRVLHIGSGAAYFPIKAWSAYCVSKAGLSMLNRCWQVEQNDIAVTSVMPGIIDTAMQAQIREAKYMDEEKLTFFKNLKKQNQLLSPETVASFLCWLLLETPQEEYSAKEWDIYDTHHHAAWLRKPHTIPHWEE